MNTIELITLEELALVAIFCANDDLEYVITRLTLISAANFRAYDEVYWEGVEYHRPSALTEAVGKMRNGRAGIEIDALAILSKVLRNCIPKEGACTLDEYSNHALLFLMSRATEKASACIAKYVGRYHLGPY